MAKINKQIKQLDAATRLVLGSRKKASVIVSQAGVMYSTGKDAASPVGLGLPKGVYRGEQLLEVYGILKHADEVKVASDQDGGGNWKIVLFDTTDGNARAHLDWQDCAPVEVAPPPTVWPVDKEQLKMFKAAYTMAAGLDKHQLRVIRLDPALGVLSYLTPTAVAQWFDGSWRNEHPEPIEIEVADIKRAVLYRGAKLIAIGQSDGKINFAYDDGAFLRVSRYDGDSYDDTQLGRVFTFDEGSYVWPLGAEQPAQALLELIAKGSSPSETDGQLFYEKYGSDEGTTMPLLMGAGKFYPKVINQLAAWAASIQPSGPDSYWENRRLAFYGEGYRAVTSINFSPDEAAARGIIEESE